MDRKGNRLRMTRQREVILEELRKVDTHPSADEVHAMVRRRLPRVSLGTIYRNLEILSEAGEIRKIESAGHVKRFDGDVGHHDHVRCIRCDRLADVRVDLSVDIDARLQADTDFRIYGHHLEFIGVCPRCQAGSAGTA
jgi:Fur family ferric uptake transcriptional regulator